jgi:bacteriocin-like protein
MKLKKRCYQADQILWKLKRYLKIKIKVKELSHEELSKISGSISNNRARVNVNTSICR